jgi:hypothetical protein
MRIFPLQAFALLFSLAAATAPLTMGRGQADEALTNPFLGQPDAIAAGRVTYVFSPGIFWSGLIVNLCGCEVQALQMNS